MTAFFRISLVAVVACSVALPVYGQRGRGGRHSERHDADHEVFQYLLQHHDKITRSVRELPDGVETLTESNDPAVAEKIKEHVAWMKVRVEQVQPIRMRDPLFAEIFRNAGKIKMEYEDTDRGVRVKETSTDPYVVRLIQAHAETVSGFVNRGFAEAMKNHPVPDRGPARDPRPARETEQRAPAIADYGKVVPLPDAAAQPRDGSKICVDVTASADPNGLHPALEKVARYVNLYEAGGAEPAEAAIAVVLHGGATLTILNDDAYAKRFGSENNPNLDCLRALHRAGVEIFVCGQSLLSHGAEQDQVVVFVDVAVSALTAVVNHQVDGYAMVQIR